MPSGVVSVESAALASVAGAVVAEPAASAGPAGLVAAAVGVAQGVVVLVGAAPVAGGVLVAGASRLAQPPNWRAREAMDILSVNDWGTLGMRLPAINGRGTGRRRERRAWQPQGEPR